MHAAYKLSEKDRIAKLKQQDAWLKTEYTDAAASLLEGLEETFTVNRLKLTPSLMRCLASTNVIENPNGAVRRVTHRVSRYRVARADPARGGMHCRASLTRLDRISGESAGQHPEERRRETDRAPACGRVAAVGPISAYNRGLGQGVATSAAQDRALSD